MQIVVYGDENMQEQVLHGKLLEKLAGSHNPSFLLFPLLPPHLRLFGLTWLVCVALFAGIESRLTRLPNWADTDVFLVAKALGLVFGALALVLGLIKNHKISLLALAFGVGALGVGEFGDLALDFAGSKAPELQSMVPVSVYAQMICGGLILAGVFAGTFQIVVILVKFVMQKVRNWRNGAPS